MWSFSDDWALRLGGQYTDQRSVGDEIGGDFDTFVYGGKVAASYRSATLTLAFSSTDDGAGIRNPDGGYPGYLSLMIKSFNRADEDAWLVGASYDFARIGVPGLSRPWFSHRSKYNCSRCTSFILTQRGPRHVDRFLCI